MSDFYMHNWTRRSFIKGAGATAAGMALSSCAINANRAPQALSEAALAVEQVVQPSTLEKPNLTVGYVPVNDCAPFAVAWEKGDRKSTRLNSSHSGESRMPSSA